MNDVEDIKKEETSLSESLLDPIEVRSLSSNTSHTQNIRNELNKIHNEQQEAMISLLFEQPIEKNKLSKAQFLIENLGIEKTHPALKKQAQQITDYHQLNQIFSKKQEDILEYIGLIRTALKDASPTVDNIRDILNVWKDQVQSVQLRDAAIKDAFLIPADPALKITLPKTEGFLAFLEHCLNKQMPKILESIAFEVQYTKPHNELTSKDIALANERWQQQTEAQFARLKNHTSSESIAKIKNWYEQIPSALTDREKKTIESNNTYPYTPLESKENRESRIEYISGCKARREQLNKASVARSLELAERKAKTLFCDPKSAPYAKQKCELSDKDRVEMQIQLGILPVSKSRNSYFGALRSTVSGTPSYQTEFSGARLDNDQLPSFPDRRELAKKMLTRLFEQRVARHPKVVEVASKTETPEEMLSQVISKVKKMKI